MFGFSFDEVPGADDYTTFALGGQPLGGLGGRAPEGSRGWATCFSVADTDAAVTATEAAGGRVTMPAQDTPFGRFAVATDPWGAGFSVMQAPGD